MKYVHINTQKGSSLIEVLIAILVVSIGLLGLATLQTQSLQSNHSSWIRSNVTHMAYDISEKMRLFKDDALDGDFNFKTQPTCSTCLVKDWQTSLVSMIGNNVDAEIVQQSVNSNRFTINISWTDSRGEIRDNNTVNGTTETFSYILEL